MHLLSASNIISDNYFLSILKHPDPPSSAAPLRSLNLPEIFYRLTARAAVRVKSPAVGAAMEPLQLGVGIPSGFQIDATGAQFAFDARQVVVGGGLRLE